MNKSLLRGMENKGIIMKTSMLKNSLSIMNHDIYIVLFSFSVVCFPLTDLFFCPRFEFFPIDT